MTADQTTAFEGGAGVAAADLTLAIAGVSATFMILWLAWIGFSNFKLWAAGRIDLHDMGWYWIRGAILTMLLSYFIR